MVSALTLWTITVIALVLGAFAIVDGIRYYQYKQLGDVVINTTGAEVYWMNPEYFVKPSPNSTALYKAPNPYSSSNTGDPITGSGYYTYSLAYNTGVLATYTELDEALDRGMTVDRWGFFDGQCNNNPPSPTNPRGKFCAINCCPPSPGGSLPPVCSPSPPTKGRLGGSHDDSCSSPPTPTELPLGSNSYCCVGQIPKKGILCSPCNPKEDSGLTSGTFAPLGAPNVVLSQCRAWYAEQDGVFVACPQANTTTTTVPKIPGGPWDQDGNSSGTYVAQPVASTPNLNAYQINPSPTLNYGQSGIISSKIQPVSGIGNAKWQFRMGYEKTSPGSKSPSNPWAGAFIKGVKPPEGSSPAAGVLPFDITNQTKNSNNGWNDPTAVTAGVPIPFQWVPDSQMIVFFIITTLISFVFGIMWFRNTNLGRSLLYWV